MVKLNFIHKLVEWLYLSYPNNLALYDQLTRLYNANWLYKIAYKQYSDKECYVTVVDLNDFKHINDSLGHIIGNAVLMSVANQLNDIKKAYPDTDICRLGGDEFIIFSRVDITSFFKYDNTKLLSYGVYYKRREMPVQHAISCADKSMYSYKASIKKNPKVGKDILNAAKSIAKEEL